jgi:hypothetical protein
VTIRGEEDRFDFGGARRRDRIINMHKISPKKELFKVLLARIKKEMAKPRVAKSART